MTWPFNEYKGGVTKLIIVTLVFGFIAMASLLVMNRSESLPAPLRALLAPQSSHPCDTTPVSVQSVTVGQPFTFGWCHPQAAEQVSSYTVYRNGDPFASVPASSDPPNAQGLYYSSITRTETQTGQTTWGVSAVNSTGEGARGGPLSVSVLPAPAIVPSSPVQMRVVLT